MKKALALLLILSTLLALAACGGNNSSTVTTTTTGTTATTTVPTTATGTPMENTSTTSTQKPTTTMTTATTAASSSTSTTKKTTTTTKPSTTITTKPSTTTTTRPTTTTTTKPSTSTTTNTKPTTTAKDAYFVRFELVSKVQPNAYYIDGVDMLTAMFGENTALQTGDTLTYKVVMSDGGSDFEMHRAVGCDYTVNGNLITFTINGKSSNAGIAVNAKNKEGTVERYIVEYDYIYRYSGNIVEDEWAMYMLLREFGEHHGLKYRNGSDIRGYTADDESLSLTGDTRKLADDFIPIPNNPDWVKELIWLVKEYQKMGFTEWHYNLVYASGFDVSAQ